MSGYRFDKLKILVVDDNPHMRKLVVTILQAFGATLAEAEGDGGARRQLVALDCGAPRCGPGAVS